LFELWKSSECMRRSMLVQALSTQEMEDEWGAGSTNISCGNSTSNSSTNRPTHTPYSIPHTLQQKLGKMRNQLFFDEMSWKKGNWPNLVIKQFTQNTCFSALLIFAVSVYYWWISKS
jgi:hypothetical protein